MNRFLWMSLVSFFIFSAGARAEEGTSRLSLASIEGFGNVARQDLQGGGNSLAGGVHWTPAFSLSDQIALRGFVGPQTFKSTSSTGSDIYVVADYLLAAEYRTGGHLGYQLGGGGGTDLRKDGTTRLGALAGAEYGLSEKLFGVIDRLNLRVAYYFNSSDLWVVNYGAGITF